MKLFSDIIKEKRLEKKLFLREVSAITSIDQSIISKFEKGERNPSREQVLKFAQLYEINPCDLIISWQSDNVAFELLTEKDANEILKAAEIKVKLLKKLKR